METVSTQVCDFNKNKKFLSIASKFFGGTFPNTFFVESHHTKRTVMFYAVQPGDVLFDEDQWDGEQMIYQPAENLKNIDYMVVYHGW